MAFMVKFLRFIEIIPMDKVDFNYMLPDDISFFVHCIGNGYRDDLVELMVINMTAQITVRDSKIENNRYKTGKLKT